MNLLRLLLLSFLIAPSVSHSVDKGFTEALTEIRSKYGVPGLTGALSIDGKIKLLGATGVRKIGQEAPLGTEDKFHIGSCTKAFTATLAATFVEEGKVHWGSKLSELFPELKVHDALKDVRFDDLLSHRSGLIGNPEDELSERLMKLESSEARKELTHIFLKKDLAVQTGTYEYSNVGYIMIGHILEKIGGKSWETLISERIFSPLGMSSCGFGPTSDPLETLVLQPWGHYLEGETLVPVHYDNAPFYGPAGTVHCSLADWNKFLNLHIQGFNGKSNLLRAETFVKLHTPYPAAGETYTYGAWRRFEAPRGGGPFLTHGGSNTLNLATVWLAPKKKAVFLSTTNIGGKPAELATDAVVVDLMLNRMDAR